MVLLAGGRIQNSHQAPPWPGTGGVLWHYEIREACYHLVGDRSLRLHMDPTGHCEMGGVSTISRGENPNYLFLM